MTNQYEMEDVVPDTTEVTLANIAAHRTSLAAADQYADEITAQIWAQMKPLWDAATPEAKAELEAIYAKVDALKKSLKLTLQTESSVLELVGVLGSTKQSIEKELSELTDAIYDIDTDHPVLHSLIETLSDDAYEYAAENIYQDALEEAHSEAWNEVSAQVKRLFPQSQWVAIHRFVAALDGQEPLNDIQRGLFLSLLQTFAVDEAAAS